MGLLDGILGQVSEHVDIANLAQKLGLPHDQVLAALAALTQAHPQPGDTVASAAQSTGMAPDTLRQIVEHIGGEGMLGRLSGMLGESGGAGGVMGALGGLLGGKS